MLELEEGSSPGPPCFGGTFWEGPVEESFGPAGLSTVLHVSQQTGPKPEIQRLHWGLRFESQMAAYHVGQTRKTASVFPSVEWGWLQHLPPMMIARMTLLTWW